MNITMFLVVLLFGIYAIWFSHDIWSNPDGFLDKVHKMRKDFKESPLGFLSQFGYSDYLDENPQVELWMARFGFLFVYVVTIFGLYKSL